MSSLIAMVMLLGGMLFKNQHWPGADVLLIAGGASGVFTAIFMITSFAGKHTSGLEKINIIFSSLTIAVVLLSFVFKVLHWPGAAKLVWIADIGIGLSALLFLIDGIREKDPLKSGQKIMSMFFLLFLLMLIVLTQHSAQ